MSIAERVAAIPALVGLFEGLAFDAELHVRIAGESYWLLPFAHGGKFYFEPEGKTAYSDVESLCEAMEEWIHDIEGCPSDGVLWVCHSRNLVGLEGE